MKRVTEFPWILVVWMKLNIDACDFRFLNCLSSWTCLLLVVLNCGEWISCFYGEFRFLQTISVNENLDMYTFSRITISPRSEQIFYIFFIYLAIFDDTRVYVFECTASETLLLWPMYNKFVFIIKTFWHVFYCMITECTGDDTAVLQTSQKVNIKTSSLLVMFTIIFYAYFACEFDERQLCLVQIAVKVILYY